MSGALAAARRILVLKLDELGDFVLATPMLRALRASAPQAQIMLATTAAVLPLTEHCPHIDAAVTPVGDVMGGKFSFRGRTPADLQTFAAAFRAGFDIAINARFDFDKNGAATLAAATRAPLRLAYAENVTPWKAQNNRGFDAAYTRVLPADPIVAHEVTRNLALVAALGGVAPADPQVELYLTDDEKRAAAALLETAFGGVRPRRLLAVAPTANVPRKNYPIPLFVQLLTRLTAAAAFDGLALLGTADGAGRAAALTAALTAALNETLTGAAASLRIVDLTGRTDVRAAAGVIAACDAMAAVDTGPAHMAAALSIPVAALFCQPRGGDPVGPYAPERFRPWGRRVLTAQPPRPAPPCVDKCLSGEPHCIGNIDPADAAAAIAAFFQETAA